MLRRRHIKDPLDIRRRLVNSSLAASVLFLVVPMGYVLMMLSIDIASSADPVEIYIRNISSIVAIFIAGLFFDNFRKVHQTSEFQYMKHMKPVTVYLGIAAIVKVLISVYYLILCITNGNIVMLFYVGEILIWTALALFAFSYRRRLDIKK